MTAASPGVIALFMPNQFYGSDDEYISALADAMKEEYDAIHAAGIVLQIDCPDLAAGWPVAEARGSRSGGRCPRRGSRPCSSFIASASALHVLVACT